MICYLRGQIVVEQLRMLLTNTLIDVTGETNEEKPIQFELS